jgi:DNA-binding NarL/FixJ family response regulator
MLDGEAHYRVHEAGDGWEAIVLARRHQPDLVLLDLTMPRMSGVDALPSIKAVAPDSRIVILSSAADKEAVAAAAEVGAVAFIDKAEGLSYLQDHVELVLAS